MLLVVINKLYVHCTYNTFEILITHNHRYTGNTTLKQNDLTHSPV